MTIEGGFSVSYRNLQSGEGMDCGTHEGEFSDLLVWMVENGNGADTAVFLDKQYLCMLYEETHENSNPYPFLGAVANA